MLIENWSSYNHSERMNFFHHLERTEAEELFIALDPAQQAELLEEKSNAEKRSWLKCLAPDDMVDLIQFYPEEEQALLIQLLDTQTQKEVKALLAYAEDDAGGLMNPRFVRLRPEMEIEEALKYLRIQAKTHVETIYYAYVLNKAQQLLGVVSLKQIIMAPANAHVEDIMTKDLIKVPADMDQEQLGELFSHHELVAIPVVDSENKIQGIVTLDDIVSVVEEEATEDIHKIGGIEALDEPYFQSGLFGLLKKRAGWLVILFFSEMLTASAMGHYQDEISKAVVLALFIPLIISSGGNSGSQASTLIIRAMVLKEIGLRDWWKVFIRELTSGVILGSILGLIGIIRIIFWPAREALYGAHYQLIALSVGLSLVGVVTWGTLSGSMLPFMLKKLKFDPASASAPFVATIVDVTGLVIYFTVSSAILKGTLI